MITLIFREMVNILRKNIVIDEYLFFENNIHNKIVIFNS